MWNVLIDIVHYKMNYGQGFLAEVTTKTLDASGVWEVLCEGINIGEKDFSSPMSRFPATGADPISFIGKWRSNSMDKLGATAR
jgi:branched-chain amino acid transport system substrate-binding protein